MITVFTPTYNRISTLPNLYKSLQRQTSYDFEWLIIDDESSDNTSSLIEKWIKENNSFPIRYYKQTHGGKHRALNKGFDLANGELFFIVDSDDYLTDDAIEIVNKMFDSVEEGFAGVSGLRMTPQEINNYQTVNNRSAFTYIDATNLDRGKYGLTGDHAEVYKTKVIREHKFPEFINEYFVTEGVCFNSIAAEGLKIRWFNIPIYICKYRSDGLTLNDANGLTGHANNYQGYVYYIRQCHDLLKKYEFAECFDDYKKTADKIGLPINKRLIDLNISIKEYNYYNKHYLSLKIHKKIIYFIGHIEAKIKSRKIKLLR